MNDTDTVSIATDIARRADVYHTEENCQAVQNSTLTDISYYTARRNGVEECGNCRRLKMGGGFADTPARQLAEMDPDEVDFSGGEKA